jgi:O-antigen/teichoic acid export membrane protein
MSLRLAGVLLSYASNIILSRALGLQGYGQYVVALGWALVLTLPARGGFENAALRFVTIYYEGRSAGALRGFLRVAFGSVIVLSLTVGILLSTLGDASVLGTSPLALRVAGLMVMPLALLGVISPIMRAVQRIAASQFYDQLLRPALLIAFLVVAALTHHALNAAEAVALNALAATVALVALAAHFRRVFAGAIQSKANYLAWRQWFAMSVPMLIIGATQELMNQLEVLFLGSFAGAREAALFAAAWRLAGLTPFALTALAAIGAPLVASAYHRGAREELHQVSRVVARLGLGFAGVVSVGLLLGGKWLLSLFGAGFPAGYPVILILLVGGIVNAFTGIVGYLMVLTGRERATMTIFAGALLLSVSLNWLLVPRIGAIGAAIASSAATCGWNLVMLVYVRRALGIDASAIARPPRTLPETLNVA